jgi:uncharacterized membrane protein
MTASKSSRARNARAQGARATGGRNGSAPAGRNGTAVAGRNGTAVKDGAVKAGTGAKAGTAVKAAGRPQPGRGATADRRGPRGAAVEQDAVEAPAGPVVPLWLQLVTWALSLAGLGVSIYLTIAHFTESALIGCSESGLVNCTKVTTSPQSYVFGIPVAVLGLAFYVFAVAIMSPWAWRSRWRPREIALVRLASVVVGIGFVIYLIYAELLVIGSICLYCTSVHVLTFILFGLIAFAAAAWGLPERQPS